LSRRRLSALAGLFPAVACLLTGNVGAASPRVDADPEALRAAIESRWREIAPPGTSLEIVRLPILRHEPGEVSYRVILPDPPLRPGPRAVAVTCLVDGRPVARGLVNVEIRATRTVWEAPRPLRRGETVAAEDLVSRSVTFERPPGTLFRPTEGRRYRVAHELPAGVRLRRRDLREIPDVEAGTEILLVVRSGQATVAVPGRVRRSGNVGDTVLVHNPVTGALVEAVLEDRATAILVAPGSPQAANGRRKS
jgi:flagella basal body P-ring formation protein FlgA